MRTKYYKMDFIRESFSAEQHTTNDETSGKVGGMFLLCHPERQ